jgi:hypothetical protein
VRLTLFTLEEANRTLEEIKPELEAMVHAHRELGRVRARIDVLELAVAGATEDNPDARELKAQHARHESLGERIRHGVDRIHRRGCVIKDLDRGLLDFYSLSGDRLIYLCWQLGEPEVAHWHTLDGGFAARRPVPGRLD